MIIFALTWRKMVKYYDKLQLLTRLIFTKDQSHVRALNTLITMADRTLVDYIGPCK